MIRFIKGIVHSFGNNWVIVECNGIGYYIVFSHNELLLLGQEVFIYTYQQFSEDQQTLYGFIDKEELDLFEQLILVKGLGCKTAMNILSCRKQQDIIQAIEKSDISFLKSIPGLGSKTAQQIILDLKGKLVYNITENYKEDSNLQEAISALKNLGYKIGEINQIKNELIKSNCHSADEYLKLGLKLLIKQKGI